MPTGRCALRREGGRSIQLSSVIAALLGCAAGVLLVVQNGVNTNLRREALGGSAFATGSVSFAVAFCTMSFVICGHSQLPGVRRDWSFRRAPLYSYLGGVIGPIYVISAVYLVELLSFATFQLCAILGQVIASLLMDWTGFLGLQKRSPTLVRLAASLALAGGTALTIDGVGEGFDDEPWWALTLSILAAICAGAVLPIQAAINAVLQRHLHTPFRVVAVSMFVGALILSFITLITVAIDDLPYVRPGQPWMWVGGLCGAFLVTSNVIGVPRIGAAAYSAIFVASQLMTAFIFDSVGAMNFDVVELSAQRVTGVCLAIVAAVVYQVQPKLSRQAPPRERDVAIEANETSQTTSSA
ncbi:hypothetical protein AB1Y20_005105 [Prymnesium parvum]|uniref:EamA domain-containing protein n=1 Tax=Prymnesium parvum TaxID=97485 RepID=A0AB34J3D1_PRYPA